MNTAIKCTIIATLATGLCLGAAAGADGRLVPGFDAEQARHRLGHVMPPSTCPPAPPPIVDMGGIVSRYDPKDSSQSHVDPGRDAASKAQEAGLTAFAKQIDRLSDIALLAKPADAALDACIMGHLAAWARADALDRNLDDNDRVGRDQAVMEQAWYGAAFASVVAKIDGYTAVPGPDSDAVKAWFGRLAASIMASHGGALASLHPANNHRYWAGTAGAASGTWLQDRRMVEFGRTVLAQGLRDVAADGSLPAEMARGRKALTYQYFATLPLAALVTIADRNGMPLDGAEEAALERLVAFGLDASRDQGKVEALAHAGQDPAVTGFALAWNDMLLPYMARRDHDLAMAMEGAASRPGMRPAWFVFLGGDVTAAYDPGARSTGAK